MVTHYTVVQYLPNPLSGERVNVGVIAMGGGQISARFVDDWRRIASFGAGDDISFIRDFARRIEAAANANGDLPGLVSAGRLDEERLKKIVGTWMHSLQFSELRASLAGPQQTLDEMASIFLRPRRHITRGRTRTSAAALVAHSVFAELDELTQNAHELVKRNHPIKGQFEQHSFDVVVANGKPFFAAQGLSFEIADSRMLDLEVDATAFAISDVHAKYRDLPLGVLTLPPQGKSKLFNKAQSLFQALKADVVESEDELNRWAKRTAKRELSTKLG
jgi:Protein of unknown function (DUF3037)